MSEPILPPGWTVTQLGDLGRWSSGGTPSRGHLSYYGGHIPWVKTGELRDCHIRSTEELITDEGLANSSAKVFPAGTLLIAMYGATIGQLGIVDMPAATNQACAALVAEATTAQLIPYLFYYVRGQREALKAGGQGGAQPNISQGFLKEYKVRLAPVAEQKRIVDAVETQLPRLDAAVATLERVQRNLKRYRASVLKAAVEGRLVPTEAELARAEKRDYEPAERLLQRILSERRRRWEEAELAKMIAAGKMPKDDGWKLRYRQPPAPDTHQLPELPVGWSWATVESLSTKVVDGVHKKPDYVETGIPFVTVRNLTAGPGISFAKLNHVTRQDHEEFVRRANPERGDILISKDGTLGVTRAVRTDVEFSIFVSVALIKPVDLSMTDYLELALSAPQVQAQMVPKGSGLQHIHLEDLRQDCVPIPPLVEQHRIVKAIQEQLSIMDELERSIPRHTLRCQRLRQSILKWAFEGKLADQDSTDEPASALLERIRSERAAASTGKAAPNDKTKKSPGRKPGRPAKKS